MNEGTDCFGKWTGKGDCITCKCRHSCKRKASEGMIYRFCTTCVAPRFFRNNRCIECGESYAYGGTVDESKKHIKRA